MHVGFWCWWTHVVLGAVSKGRSSSRKNNFLPRELGFWCLAFDVALEFGLSTPSDERRLHPEKVNNSRCSEETQNQRDGASDWPCADPIFTTPSWFSASPSLALPTGSLPDNWRNELLHRAGDTKRHPGPKSVLSLRGRDVLVQDVLFTSVQRCDGAVAEVRKRFESQRHPWARRPRSRSP